MRPSIRVIITAVLAVLLSTAVAGCSDEDNPPGSPGDQTTTVPVGS